jgi:hypothetical protein
MPPKKAQHELSTNPKTAASRKRKREIEGTPKGIEDAARLATNQSIRRAEDLERKKPGFLQKS